MIDFGVERTYPKKLYDKVIKTGSVASGAKTGRPLKFSPGCWDKVVSHIREHRSRRKKASTRKLARLITKGRRKGSPSHIGQAQ